MTVRFDWIRGGRAATLLTNLALLGTGVVSSAVASRLLGPTGRGEYVAWQAWAAAIGVLVVGGLPQVLVLDDWTPGRHRLRELLAPLGIGVALTVVAAATAVTVLHAPTALTVGFVLIVAATGCAAVGAAEAQRMGRMRGEFNLARAVPPLAGLVAMALLGTAHTGSAPTWLVTVGVLQAVTTLGWLLAVADRRRVQPAPIRPTVAAALRLAPGNAVTMAQYRFDMLAVALFCRPEVVAFYAIAVAAQSAVLAAGQTNGMMWFVGGRADGDDRRARTRAELRRTAATATAVAVVLAAGAGLWVRLGYGAAFLPAVPVVVVLCAVGIVQSLDYLLAHDCLLVGRGNRVLLYRAPSLAVLIVGFAVGVHEHWPAAAIAVLPGIGYALSTVVFYRAGRVPKRAEPPVRYGILTK